MDSTPLIVYAEHTVTGERYLLIDSAKHGYDAMLCETYPEEDLNNRPLRPYLDVEGEDIFEVQLTAFYNVPWDEEFGEDVDEDGTYELITGESMDFEQDTPVTQEQLKECISIGSSVDGDFLAIHSDVKGLLWLPRHDESMILWTCSEADFGETLDRIYCGYYHQDKPLAPAYFEPWNELRNHTFYHLANVERKDSMKALAELCKSKFKEIALFYEEMHGTEEQGQVSLLQPDLAEIEEYELEDTQIDMGHAAVSRDGRWIAYGSQLETIDGNESKEDWPVVDENARVYAAVAIDAGMSKLAVGTFGGMLHILDLNSQEMDEYGIGTGTIRELERYVLWRGEDPVRCIKKYDGRGNLRQVHQVHQDHQNPHVLHHVDRPDSRLQGMGREDRQGNRHAILGLRWEREVETERWVNRGMDKDKDKDKDRDRVAVDNKGKGNPQLSG
ncbi:hypothetical protein G195_003035 [Phytophthora kernoviae 00238/432]|uniref:Uncharacterized protein n=1 Tax=Phytophthora kernoviae 00238/432 TaxID=1284355 RepID=A0A8J4WA49_9STRA|nr:hypothetical protein G195_003035 [Phytophthora kernoviae 00238/432]